ncbi:MFS transporter [Actinoallomurus sp. NPDC052274]|uniref:MFS transporter n=1 Tax=Actinoallomurus sp. NPDC052274 TaxID=3155420 RepID=UPI0034376119
MSIDRETGRSRLLMDTAPWRASRDFRRVWISGTVTFLGSVFTMTAVPLQIADITGSPLAVGAIGAVELVPTIVFGLYGGALADAVDRRTMVLTTEIVMGFLSVLLLINATLDVPMLWPLYIAAGGAAAVQGLQQPALEAMIPRLLPPDQLVAASALISVRWSVGAVIAPAAAGVVVATAGIPAAYTIDLVTFVLSVALLARVRPMPSSPEAGNPALRQIAQGARYAARRPDLMGTCLVDMAATALALPTALFPFLAHDLHAQWALGLLYAASAAGSLLAAAAGGWIGRVHRHGRMVLLAGAVVGAAMVGAAFSTGVWLVLVFLAIAGAANWTGDTFRTAIWNQSIPDHLRGRLAGIELLIGSAGPALGDVRAGGLAGRYGIRLTMWSGGLACMSSVAVLTTALPALWRYDSRTLPRVTAVCTTQEDPCE